MSGWHEFYRFWVSQQTIPGNVLPDILIGAATYIIGKYKVGPWIKQRHQEHLDQKERHHQEQVACHKALFELHQKQHQELLDQHSKMLDQHRQLLEATRANTASRNRGQAGKPGDVEGDVSAGS